MVSLKALYSTSPTVSIKTAMSMPATGCHTLQSLERKIVNMQERETDTTTPTTPTTDHRTGIKLKKVGDINPPESLTPTKRLTKSSSKITLAFKCNNHRNRNRQNRSNDLKSITTCKQRKQCRSSFLPLLLSKSCSAEPS